VVSELLPAGGTRSIQLFGHVGAAGSH